MDIGGDAGAILDMFLPRQRALARGGVLACEAASGYAVTLVYPMRHTLLSFPGLSDTAHALLFLGSALVEVGGERVGVGVVGWWASWAVAAQTSKPSN